LRRLLNLGQLIQSHALSYFYLSAPDLILGMDHPPDKRNVFGLAESNPNLLGTALPCASLARKSSHI
jgi:NAD-reducing hydrogenase large subunit